MNNDFSIVGALSDKNNIGKEFVELNVKYETMNKEFNSLKNENAIMSKEFNSLKNENESLNKTVKNFKDLYEIKKTEAETLELDFNELENAMVNLKLNRASIFSN